MAVLGLGLGATMQNLVLAVQNTAPRRTSAPASSVVAFFRSMGGSIGVSALGAVLAHQVSDAGQGRHPAAGGRRQARARSSSPGCSTPPATSPTWARCPAPVRTLYEAAFGEATGHLFLIAAAVRRRRALLRALHQGDAAADHVRAGRRRARGDRGPRGGRAMSTAARPRTDALRDLEQRGRRAGPPRPAGHRRARARPSTPSCSRSSYLMLGYMNERGPGAGVGAVARRSTSTRARSAGRSSTCVDLGLVDRTPDPDDGRATLRQRQRRGPAPDRATSATTAASCSPSGSATGRPTSSTTFAGDARPLQHRPVDGER